VVDCSSEVNVKTNIKIRSTLSTHEGAPAIAVSALKELRRATMANLLWEDQFYESGEDSAARIASLVKRVSFAEAAQVAIEAREKFKLRHVPLHITVELIHCQHHGRQVGDLIARVIHRPDEMGELVALYWKDGKKPITAQMRIGLCRALKKFTQYQLTKWG
jgi:60 kDa SS-A/Ro ribonucleoprotein